MMNAMFASLRTFVATPIALLGMFLVAVAAYITGGKPKVISLMRAISSIDP